MNSSSNIGNKFPNDLDGASFIRRENDSEEKPFPASEPLFGCSL